MPWKKDDNGAYIEDNNGNPIFVLDGGEERSVDYLAMSKALTEASRESAGRKDTIRKMEAAAKAWEGVEDIPAFIAAARKDAEAVKAMSDKEKDAEEAARARVLAATSPLEKKIAELEAEKAGLQEQYNVSVINSQFGTSKYVNEELVNAAMAQELFAKHFSIEDGKLVAKDDTGNIIYDENGPAGFETAMRKLVSVSSYKSFLLKGSGAKGSGATPGVQGGRMNTDNMTSVQKIAAGLKKRGGVFAG